MWSGVDAVRGSYWIAPSGGSCPHGALAVHSSIQMVMKTVGHYFTENKFLLR